MVSDKNLMTAIKGKAVPVAGCQINICRFNNMPMEQVNRIFKNKV